MSLLEFGSSEADIRAAVESISRDGANAVMVLESPETFQKRTLIAKLLGDANLPAISAFTESVEAGGLMAYSFDLIELHKRAANNIDAILLALQLPFRFEVGAPSDRLMSSTPE